MAIAKKPVAKTSAKAAPAKASAKAPAAPVKKGFPARKPGTKPAARPARKPLPTFKAPEDFKPHFVEVTFKTEKDGLIGSGIRAIRYVGRYDPAAEDKKKFDMKAYDMPTVIGIQARLAAVTYATSALKRLDPNTFYQVILRVNRKAADQSISVLCKGILKVVKSAKTGRLAPKAMEKTDPAYRKIRKAMRILPAAFKEVLMPPKRTRGAVKKDEADDE